MYWVAREGPFRSKCKSRNDYNIFRWYRAAWGRYSQADPIGLDGGTNVYAYTLGNPIEDADLLGLASSTTCCVEFSSLSPGREIGGFGTSLLHVTGNPVGNMLEFDIDCPSDRPVLRELRLESNGSPPWTPARHPWPQGWDRTYYRVGSATHYIVDVTVPTRTWWFHHSDLTRVRVGAKCCER